VSELLKKNSAKQYNTINLTSFENRSGFFEQITFCLARPKKMTTTALPPITLNVLPQSHHEAEVDHCITDNW
jgi:hypothetical protein